MNESPNHVPIGTRSTNGWSLIPALAVAGLISAIAVDFFVWFPSIVWVKSYILFVLLASVSLGLSLAAVLWLYGLIRTWRGFVAALGVTIAAHFFGELGDRYLPRALIDYVDIPLLGSIIPELLLTVSVVAFIMTLAFLMIAWPKRKVAWVILISFVCSVLAGVTVAVIDGTQRGAWFSPLKGTLLGLSWQLALALFLAIALLLGRVEFGSHTPRDSDEYPAPSLLRRFAPLGILVVFFLVTRTWCRATQVRYATRNSELQAHEKTEIAKSLAEAPRLEKAPAPKPQPIDEVLLLKDINGWKPYFSGSQAYGPEMTGGDTVAPALARRTYYARYATPGDNMAVVANVTEYPNAEWARYAVRNTPMPHEFIKHSDSVKPLVRFGSKVYQDGPNVFWPSGQELVVLECSGVLPNVINEFVKAYLVKYPSSLG